MEETRKAICQKPNLNKTFPFFLNKGIQTHLGNGHKEHGEV
jgi:hypothetical protein